MAAFFQRFVPVTSVGEFATRGVGRRSVHRDRKAPASPRGNAEDAPSASRWGSPPGTYLYETVAKLYDAGMATMNISAARDKLPEAVELARTEAVFLERYGRPAAVLVSPERYEVLLSALEDAEDVAAFDAAMAEEGDNVPWDQVKADLGWT